ncbi:MAG: GNAT family N-acetyltransferase [Candidatus Bathyarchaeota archaeon]|nr:MAG: GNAT family N-acetyltransferase [Candidatus Bathyarchaeota archaeon]
MIKLRVRQAKESDIPELLVLAEEFMPQEAVREKRADALRQALKNPAYELLVAEIKEEPAGFIDQWIISDFIHGAKLSCIQNFYVASKHRMKGVGSKLLEEIIRRAETKGVLEIHVVTEFENERAIDLYRRHGFLTSSLQLERALG